MQPMMWRRVSDVLDDILELPADDRVAAAEARCADDAELLTAVLDHLRADASDGVLDHGFETPTGLVLAAECADLAPGTAVDRFTVVERLGAGGMGTVYRALDPTLDRDVAIKLLSPGASNRAVARFTREARMLAALQHPNISTIFESGVDADRPFIAMELVRGRTLADIDGDRFDLVDRLDVARQVASALEAAHSRGVIHRDLKPGNVMVSEDGLVKVLDFGLATRSGEAIVDVTPSTESRGDRPLTGAGHVLGTPGYMSPEQIRGEAIAEPSDVFAFGCVVYELLARRRLFTGSLAKRMRRAIDGPADVSALVDMVPGEVAELVIACLATTPDERPSTSDARRRLGRVVDRLRHRGDDGPSPLSDLLVPSTTFVGREDERRELERLIESNAWVTVVGTGGVGKTRLVQEVARGLGGAFDGGVAVVWLASVTDGDLVADRVRAALGVHDRSPDDAMGDIVRRLRRTKSLLVLDNCEHVLDACRELAEALRGESESRVVATSRERLGVDGEVAVPLGSMPPDDARALFVDRIRESGQSIDVEPSRDAIDDVCTRLDALPFALELAAARANVLTVDEIAKRLDERFRLLSKTGDLPGGRHLTLHSLIDWSFDLLRPPAQAILPRLSAFAGSWSIEAAEAVGAGDGAEPWQIVDLVSELVDKSLVERDLVESARCRQARFRLLESVRAYGADRLRASGEADGVHERLVAHLRELILQLPWAFEGDEQQMWTARFVAEEQTIVATARSPKTDAFARLEIVGRIGRLWSSRGQWSLTRDLLVRALELGHDLPPSPQRFTAITGLGASISMQTGKEDRSLTEAAVAEARRLNDPRRLSLALNNLAVTLKKLHEYDRAREVLAESLDCLDECSDRRARGTVLLTLSALESSQSRWEDADLRARDALSTWQTIGDDRGRARAHERIAANARAWRDWPMTRAHALAGYELAERHEAAHLGPRLLYYLGALDVIEGNLDAAKRHADRVREWSERASFDVGLFLAHQLWGDIFAADDDHASALDAFDAAARMSTSIQDETGLDVRRARIERRRGRVREAAALLSPVLVEVADLSRVRGVTSTMLFEASEILGAAGRTAEAASSAVVAAAYDAATRLRAPNPGYVNTVATWAGGDESAGDGWAIDRAMRSAAEWLGEVAGDVDRPEATDRSTDGPQPDTISKSSTSKINVARGGMTGGRPPAP